MEAFDPLECAGDSPLLGFGFVPRVVGGVVGLPELLREEFTHVDELALPNLLC